MIRRLLSLLVLAACLAAAGCAAPAAYRPGPDDSGNAGHVDSGGAGGGSM